MTLKASTTPSGYEGEIDCTVAWIQDDPSEKVPSGDQFLYLRIKKRPMLKAIKKTKGELEGDEPLMENILTGMIKEILDDPCLDEMAKRIDNQPIALYTDIDNCEAPGISYLDNNLVEEEKDTVEELYANYTNVTNTQDGKELGRKIVFLNVDYNRLTESIVDNTLFNIMQEATHSECDLLKAPRTYISKK